MVRFHISVINGPWWWYRVTLPSCTSCLNIFILERAKSCEGEARVTLTELSKANSPVQHVWSTSSGQNWNCSLTPVHAGINWKGHSSKQSTCASVFHLTSNFLACRSNTAHENEFLECYWQKRRKNIQCKPVNVICTRRNHYMLCHLSATEHITTEKKLLLFFFFQ